MRLPWPAVLAIPLVCPPVRAADEEYRTVETVIKTKVQAAAATPAGPAVPGFLGVEVRSDSQGRPVVEDVQPSSPADQAGLKAGDQVNRLDGKELGSADAFRSALHTRSAGDSVQLAVTREGKAVELSVRLAPVSRPMPAGRGQPSPLGVQVAAAKGGEGLTIESVTPGSIADRAKLKIGETILKLDDVALNDPEKLREAVAVKKPDDTVTLTLLLAEKRVEMKIKLEAERPGGGRFAGGGPGGGMGGWGRNRYWTRPAYKIAIILVEYPDTKHNPKIPAKAWEAAMFSRDQTYKKTVTGQDAHGSMYDYYFEQSYGKLKIEGKAFDYVEVDKKRTEYGTPGGGPRTALLTEAMDKLLAREGKDALKDFDGVFYIYAGGRMQVPRGSLYWPHRSSVQHNGKSWPYFICPEGGERMANISVFCHEFGHMLGLPDLYARPENPGMEGAGIWCAMANQAGNGRPQHFSAWCKEKLEWIQPAVIDPTVKQKLLLGPIEDSPKECYKVLAKPDGSEYFLLENRTKKGFDAALPAHGLLIWRVVGNRPILEEAHGVAGPRGPGSFPDFVPFPAKDTNSAFTPFTVPTSRSQLGGGLPVFITNIEKRSDAKVTFHIGYEYQ
ncbi:MAG TPA: M6 family metalloprotease domain-containing protein [Gemmataceae bacterium]|nr:M6 family metalloprotease domain-containing protein [Gemmataceae bacterium]